MTTPQRITLMADWWPRAAKAQGWNPSDRVKRMEVLSAAVKRTLGSASELNSREDIDAVKAHLGMLADNVQMTIESDRPEIGRARRLRSAIGEQLKCLAVYHADTGAWLASVIQDKFKHGSRAEPLGLSDLTAVPKYFTDRRGVLRESPSQLDQVMMTLAGAIQTKRKASGDSVHDMKIKAGVACVCKRCEMEGVERGPSPVARVEQPQMEHEEQPF